MKKIFSIILFLFCFSLCGCVIRISDLEETETTKKEDVVKENKPIHDIEENSTSLDYIGCEVIDDEYHGKVLLVKFDFENVSEENKTFAYTYTVKAFQNGVEMEDAIFTENEFHENSFKEIRPETKITVAESFEYKDVESPIILEVYPWISFDNEKLMEIEIKPE
mgnify:CR=1 FL=1